MRIRIIYLDLGKYWSYGDETRPKIKGPGNGINWPYQQLTKSKSKSCGHGQNLTSFTKNAVDRAYAKRYCQATKKNNMAISNDSATAETLHALFHQIHQIWNPSMSTKSKPTSSLFSNIVPTIPNRIESYETEPRQQKATHNITPTRRPWKRCIFVKNWIE